MHGIWLYDGMVWYITYMHGIYDLVYDINVTLDQ